MNVIMSLIEQILDLFKHLRGFGFVGHDLDLDFVVRRPGGTPCQKAGGRYQCCHQFCAFHD